MREQLEQVAKQTGRTPPELIAPDFPDRAAYVWEVFLDMHTGRTYGMSGPNPLSWGDIKAWCDLRGIVLLSWEVDILKALDMLWVRIANESD